jgi:hypothetical protein
MFNKITLLFIISLIGQPIAQAGEGKFSIVQEGQPVKFHATCFDDIALSKIMTWKEFIGQEFEAQKQLEIGKLQEAHKLELEQAKIETETLQKKYDFDILQKDNELKDLRKLLQRNSKVNIPAAVGASLVGGFALGFGVAYVIDHGIQVAP